MRLKGKSVAVGYQSQLLFKNQQLLLSKKEGIQGKRRKW